MAEIQKPIDLNQIWCSAGDLVKPNNSKISSGWMVEIPPRQWFNWLDNRQDQAIAHINQMGIPAWDSSTEYQANKSLTMGSDGVVYKCKVTHTAQNPATDATGTYWKQAFFENEPPASPTDNTITLPGGVVYKWGNVIVPSGGSVSFDTPFGSEVSSVVITHGPGATNGLPCAISTQNVNGFVILHDNGAIPNGFSYFAVGRD